MGISSSHGGTGQVLLGSIGLLLFLALFFIGPVEIANALYHAGLWPRLSPEDVTAAFNKQSPFTAISQYRCEDGTQGWDYICYAIREKRPNITSVPPGPVKYGGLSHAMASSKPPSLIDLPLDQPTSPRDEYLRAREERFKPQQSAR